jgi:predicted RecB family nuclease
MSKIIEVTPSLFFHFAKSPHWLWYDLHGDHAKKAELSELTKNLIEGGVLHEDNYVKDIKKVTVDKNLSESEAEQQTLEYMKAGEDLIYQGVISYTEDDIKFKGRPDFLKKVDGESKFGSYHYIPIEIKNSTKCDKAEYKNQLMLYAIILGKIQQYAPKIGRFINRKSEDIECDLSDKQLTKTNVTLAEIINILRGVEPSFSISSESKNSPWFNVMLEDAKAKSDIALIYKVPSAALKSLREAGINTLADIAQCDIEALPKIKGAGIDTLRRAQAQSKSLISNEIIKLATPVFSDSETTIYFDIEGDPFLGIEYLFGFLISKKNQESVFKYFIAENPADEEKMWKEFIAWLDEENFKDFKVYHFHNYEKTHLDKLSNKYGGSDQLTLFNENLVDLLPITTSSFIFPVYFYSIKDIAKHLNFKWQHAKASGAQSIFWYEKWLETSDRNILQDIIDYNEDDVRATEFLHVWLCHYYLIV